MQFLAVFLSISFTGLPCENGLRSIHADTEYSRRYGVSISKNALFFKLLLYI
jgi:hypothetical protein